MTFEEWKLKQDLTGWNTKYCDKTRHANQKGQNNLLTLTEYLYKAYEAKLNSHTDVSIHGYHLARINDEGDYTVDSCRFITAQENYLEKKPISDEQKLSMSLSAKLTIQGENNGRSKLSNTQAIEIFTDTREDLRLIAKDYNITPRTVFDIKTRYRWKTITAHL